MERQRERSSDHFEVKIEEEKLEEKEVEEEERKSSKAVEEKKKRCRKVLDLEEAKKQVIFAIPMIITNLSYYFITLVSVMFAGHLGHSELASSTLANSWAMVTGLALMIGLSGALETLCGQGYGAKLYGMLGIYLQSSIIISFIFSIIVSLLWFYSEPVLILFHQDPNISKMAALYLKFLIPGLFAYGCLQCTMRFFQTQSVIMPLVICSVVPLAIHVGITYALVHRTPLGFRGAALAAALSLWLSAIMLIIYVSNAKRFKHTWEGLSMECFNHVLPNMKLAIPSALMVCLEYWAFEILVFLAGLMPNAEDSTSLIAMCVNTDAVAFMITYGLSAAASTRVSNELGAGNANQAKKAMAVTLKLSIIQSLTVVIALAFGHDIWASSFTNSSTIKKEYASMTPLLVITILLDSVQGILSGVARGCGWQHLAVWTNLVAFYIIGLPIMILSGFKLGLHTKGLWIGLMCGLSCQACSLLLIALRIKWNKIELSTENERENPEVV